jgi:Transposase, Mutator family
LTLTPGNISHLTAKRTTRTLLCALPAARRRGSNQNDLEHAGYEAAARCLAEDLDALVVHLRYPLRHRERWRSTNLLERSLGEVRRRTKVMGRFPGETSCLSLVWAVLDLFFSHASNGATFTDVDRQHLYRIKYQQADPDTLDKEVTAA